MALPPFRDSLAPFTSVAPKYGAPPSASPCSDWTLRVSPHVETIEFRDGLDALHVVSFMADEIIPCHLWKVTGDDLVAFTVPARARLARGLGDWVDLAAHTPIEGPWVTVLPSSVPELPSRFARPLVRGVDR